MIFRFPSNLLLFLLQVPLLALPPATSILIENGVSQCNIADAEIDRSVSASSGISQTFYTPNVELLNFFVWCQGSEGHATVESIYFTHEGLFPTFDRFNLDDCGTFLSGRCCLVDPSPGTSSCVSDKIAYCVAMTSPDDYLTVSCDTGIMLIAGVQHDIVMIDEGYYYFEEPNFSVSSTQPDGTIRSTPASSDNLASILVVTPDAFIYPPDPCGECINDEFDEYSNVYECAVGMDLDLCIPTGGATSGDDPLINSTDPPISSPTTSEDPDVIIEGSAAFMKAYTFLWVLFPVLLLYISIM